MTEFENAEGGRPAAFRHRWIDRWRVYHPEEEYQLNTIADLLPLEDIVLNLEVASKAQLLEEIGRHMEGRHGMPQARVVLSLSRREEIGSTGLGDGVAVPHARIKYLDRIQIAYFRLSAPIPFDAPDGKPVTDIIVLLVPKQATEEHLRILAKATQMFSDQGFRERLRQSADPSVVKRQFDAWPLLG